jgi:hypothetical protein
VKELTGGIIKPIKRKDWIRQPLPYIKDEPKDQHRERRDIYLYQRSLPAPIPNLVLHGSHTKLSPESTVSNCDIADLIVANCRIQFRRWWFIDAEGQVMGRLATQVRAFAQATREL